MLEFKMDSVDDTIRVFRSPREHEHVGISVLNLEEHVPVLDQALGIGTREYIVERFEQAGFSVRAQKILRIEWQDHRDDTIWAITVEDRILTFTISPPLTDFSEEVRLVSIDLAYEDTFMKTPLAIDNLVERYKKSTCAELNENDQVDLKRITRKRRRFHFAEMIELGNIFSDSIIMILEKSPSYVAITGSDERRKKIYSRFLKNLFQYIQLPEKEHLLIRCQHTFNSYIR